MMEEPVRILQVVTHMNRGGLETMLMNYYRNIDRTRVQFDFLTHRPETEKKDYDEEIRSLGGKIFHVSPLNPFSKNYVQEIKAFFLNHPEYKVIHVHQDCMSSVVLKIAKDCGIPIRIAHCHSSNQDFNYKYFIKLFYKQFIPLYATDLISCGKKSGEWMFGKDSTFSILPNAIDTKQFAYSESIRNQVRKQLGFKDTDIVLGHVGRFSEVKNHLFMLDLFKDIYSKNSNYKMVFVGNGGLFQDCVNKAKTLGISEHVSFLGLRTDVSSLLQAMDVFLLPSIYEGFPVSVVEAQAAGLHCFISNKVPVDCILTDLVKQIPLDLPLEDWATNIMRCSCSDRSIYQEEIIKSGYDIRDNAKYLEDLYISKLYTGDCNE